MRSARKRMDEAIAEAAQETQHLRWCDDCDAWQERTTVAVTRGRKLLEVCWKHVRSDDGIACPSTGPWDCSAAGCDMLDGQRGQHCPIVEGILEEIEDERRFHRSPMKPIMQGDLIRGHKITIRRRAVMPGTVVEEDLTATHGQEFVVLILGTAPAEMSFDADEAMNKMGWFRRAQILGELEAKS